MIADSQYQCSNGGEAILVCIQAGCTSYALTCGRRGCECKGQHRSHPHLHIDEIFEKVAEQPLLPEQLTGQQKSVDSMIDGLIRELQLLRVKHRSYVHEFMEKYYAPSSLRRRLAAKEKLERNESTGDCFHRLCEEIDRPSSANKRPYRLSSSQMERGLVTARKEMHKLIDGIESLWLDSKLPKSQLVKIQKYAFSTSPRFESIVLSEGNTRIRKTTHGWVVMMLQPSLPMTSPSQVSFKIHKLQHIAFGVCYKEVVRKMGYTWTGNCCCYEGFQGCGIYLLYYDGKIYSQSREEDERVQATRAFQVGDTVTVEFDPATACITYSLDGKSFSQKTSINSSTTQPVTFFALLSGENNDLSCVN